MIKWLALVEAQTHGKVNRHHSGLGVTTKSMENSEEEDMIVLTHSTAQYNCSKTKFIQSSVKAAYLVQLIFRM